MRCLRRSSIVLADGHIRGDIDMTAIHDAMLVLVFDAREVQLVIDACDVYEGEENRDTEGARELADRLRRTPKELLAQHWSLYEREVAILALDAFAGRRREASILEGDFERAVAARRSDQAIELGHKLRSTR